MSSAQNGPELRRTVSLADEDAVKEILSSTIMGLWELVNNLTRIKPSRRERYRVAIFGSARAEPGTFVYDEVKRVAAAFAGMGCDIVTGGGLAFSDACRLGVPRHQLPLKTGARLSRKAFTASW